ncbi:MAG: hypothetical protein MJD61_14145 [Proteobacteria bacterium]|nr:hypothetical protein [Pseudomonadota bacterium]
MTCRICALALLIVVPGCSGRGPDLARWLPECRLVLLATHRARTGNRLAVRGRWQGRLDLRWRLRSYRGSAGEPATMPGSSAAAGRVRASGTAPCTHRALCDLEQSTRQDALAQLATLVAGEHDP